MKQMTDAEHREEESKEQEDRGLKPSETVSKEDADYKKGTAFDRCGKCEYYERGNHCKIVEGEIEPYGVCKFFEAPDTPQDMAHLKKAKKAKTI